MYWARHLVKLLKAVEILARPGGVTMDELRQGLEMDRRTAYRIKETLEELNFPLYEDNSGLDGRKRYRFTENYLKKLPNLSVPELNLSLSELISLYFIRGNRKMFRGTDIEANIDAAFAKLDAFMPEGLADNLDQVKTLFVSSSKFTKDYSDKVEIIEQLTEAIFRQQTMTVTYHSFHDDKKKGFKIDPLRFFERDGGLYLFVRATSFGHIRVLAVERIEKLIAAKETFTPPKDFDPDALLEDAFNIVYDDPIEVTVWFSSEVARYIKERTWGREQVISDNGDGSITLLLRTSGWFEVRKWILSFGSQAELLGPEELRADVAGELAEAGQRYKGLGS